MADRRDGRPVRTISRPQAVDETGGQPGHFRILMLSALAAVIGPTAGLVAYLLYHLIGFFTNLFFFHRLSDQFLSPRLNQLGPWVIVVPVVGGLIVGVMAKYGSPKIKGHGIPEAMEAVIASRNLRSEAFRP